jgi:RNA polymerase sigma factor (sigma-70 family)
MTENNDEAARFREDSFLDRLVPKVAERLAEQHARNFDAEASLARFQSWLDKITVDHAVVPSRLGQETWSELIERYSPLVWSICQRYLSPQDASDVWQSVWLLLIENIDKLQDTAALPSWLAITTRRECQRTLRTLRRHDHVDLPPEDQMPIDADRLSTEQAVIIAERDAALRAAFAELPSNCRDLLSMLIADPPLTYADISARLGIPVNSIGPRRARCLDKLRRSPRLAGILGDESRTSKPERREVETKKTGR